MAENLGFTDHQYYAERRLLAGGLVKLVEARHVIHFDGPHSQHVKARVGNMLLTFSYDRDAPRGGWSNAEMFEQIPGIARHTVCGAAHPDDPAHHSHTIGIDTDTFLGLPRQLLSGEVRIHDIGKKTLYLLVDYADALREEVEANS